MDTDSKLKLKHHISQASACFWCSTQIISVDRGSCELSHFLIFMYMNERGQPQTLSNITHRRGTDGVSFQSACHKNSTKSASFTT